MRSYNGDVRTSEDVEVDVVGKVPNLGAIALHKQDVIIRHNRRHIIGTDEALRTSDDGSGGDCTGDALAHKTPGHYPGSFVGEDQHPRWNRDNGFDSAKGSGDQGPGDCVIRGTRGVGVKIKRKPRL